MTDPRIKNVRLSAALRYASGLGQRSPHQLMLRAAEAIADIEQTLSVIQMAIDRGDLELTKLRLKHISNVLGCGDIVINGVDTNANPHSQGAADDMDAE